MRLLEAKPKNPIIATYVDRYQFFDIRKPSYFQAIPNGKIEGYIVLEGCFERRDPNKNEFVSAPKSGFLSASNQVSYLRVPSKLVCLNVKMNLRILALPHFQHFNHRIQDLSLACLLAKQDLDVIQQKHFVDGESLNSSSLDNLLSPILQSHDKNLVVEKIISNIEESEDFMVGSLAEKMNMSSKTLERNTKKYFNLTPKELWNILRFERTTTHLKQSDVTRFLDVLSFGYYDQSHFVKDCKKITGLSPKKLFTRMKLSTNDLFL